MSSKYYGRYIKNIRETLPDKYKVLKDDLLRISKTIVEYDLDNDEYVDVIYNAARMSDMLLIAVDKIDKESVELIVKYLIECAEEGVVHNDNNTLLKDGYEKIKKEEELQKLGVKGTRGITICPRCKMDNIIIFSKQKRSADEGESVINTCVDCGNRWFIS